MTDFTKWDRFDADSAEVEVERKAEVDEARRLRILEERKVLNDCQDLAATLKSEAVVLTLKAKRGSRGGGRRPRPSKSAHHAPQSTDNNNAAPGAEAIPANTESIDGGVAKGGADVDASRARTNADEADALAKSLRLGLGLRDEVVACAEAGDLYQGVMKARECLLELNTSQRFLSKSSPSKQKSDADQAVATCCGGGGGNTGGGHDHAHAHAHAHAHHGHGHRDRDQQPCPAPSAGCAGGAVGHAGAIMGAGGASRARKEDARKVAAGAMGVLRRAKVVCVVAEGDCLLGDGRAAQATEALRDLLLEVPASVPAWVARGKAFLSMGNPLLAGLHFDRALELDSACTDAAAYKENLRVAGLPAVAVGETCEHPLPVSSNSVSAVDNRGNEDDLVVTTAKSVSPGVTAEVQGGTGTACCVGRARKSRRDADRGALAEACEEYRAGVVLHQEAFLRSSRGKFCRVLELLDEVAEHAEQDGQTNTAPANCARGSNGEESSAREDSRPAGETVVDSKAGGGGEGISGEGRALLYGGGAVLTRVRVACHLNIAAAALLRKTEYESAVDHCTRALVVHPGNSQALVRRAQAYEELGRFRLAVEDLEAAEASVLTEMCRRHPQEQGVGEVLPGELGEVRRRLEHARWTKIHVGNGQDDLPITGCGAGKIATETDDATG